MTIKMASISKIFRCIVFISIAVSLVNYWLRTKDYLVNYKDIKTIVNKHVNKGNGCRLRDSSFVCASSLIQSASVMVLCQPLQGIQFRQHLTWLKKIWGTSMGAIYCRRRICSGYLSTAVDGWVLYTFYTPRWLSISYFLVQLLTPAAIQVGRAV